MQQQVQQAKEQKSKLTSRALTGGGRAVCAAGQGRPESRLRHQFARLPALAGPGPPRRRARREAWGALRRAPLQRPGPTIGESSRAMTGKNEVA